MLGGPKNYADKTSLGNETCKIRGFTLHITNSQLINFESVKTLVLDPSEKTITVTNPHKICKDKRKRKLYDRGEEKTIRWCIPNVGDSTLTIQNPLGIDYNGVSDCTDINDMPDVINAIIKVIINCSINFCHCHFNFCHCRFCFCHCHFNFCHCRFIFCHCHYNFCHVHFDFCPFTCIFPYTLFQFLSLSFQFLTLSFQFLSLSV